MYGITCCKATDIVLFFIRITVRSLTVALSGVHSACLLLSLPVKSHLVCRVSTSKTIRDDDTVGHRVAADLCGELRSVKIRTRDYR